MELRTVVISKALVAVLVLVIYGVVHALPFLKLLPDTVLISLIGSDATLAAAVVYYYFGSSASSQSKDETIKSLSGANKDVKDAEVPRG